MALAYLLSPTFQIENTAGKPASGGHLEVYVAGSRDKYYCASDFNGTLHPFKIELDSLGSNIVLADDTQAYDVYVYNRYGGLMMSRYNVKPGSGGGVSGATITSSDGSIEVIPTATGVDLRVDSELPTTLRCSGSYDNGSFSFVEFQRDGQNAFVNNSNQVIVNEGWWHYDVTARIHWPADPAQNETVQVSLVNPNTDTFDEAPLDLTYAHYETRQIGGEFKCTQDGTVFSVTMTGVPAGASVELIDFGIHSVIGEGGAGGKYNAGDGIDIDEPNRVISVDFSEVQAKLTAGTGITIDENNVISATEAEIYVVEWGNEQPASVYDDAYAAYQAGKTLVFRRAGLGECGIFCKYTQPYGLIFAVPHTNLSGWDFTEGWMYFYILYKSGQYSLWKQGSYNFVLPSSVADAGKVLTVNPQNGQPKWSSLPAQQQANWTEDDNTSVQYIQNKPANLVQDANYVHTDNNFTDADVSKLSGIAAGAEVNVQSNWTEADTTADSYIQNKPTEKTLAAGSNITLTESGSTVTIAATAAPQQQANWTEADSSSVQYIQNKPANLVQDANYVHTDNNYTNADASKLAGIAAGAEVNVQSDWTEADSAADSYILHKPVPKTLTAGNNITITDVNNIVTISSQSDPQVQADWTEADSAAVDYIKNKPQNLVQDAAYVHTDNNFTTTLKDKLDGIASGAEVNVQADWDEVDSSADSYIQNKPNLASKENVANKVQSIVGSSQTAQTDYPSVYAVADFVNSSVATNTAKFLGNFTLADLSLTYPSTDAQIETALDGYAFSPAPTNNDYVYVEIQDPQTPGVTDVVKRFKFDGSNWLYEYSLNNSSFTAAEIAAIDSGVTATKVGNYDTHIADTTIHVTSTDKTTWNGKQDAISDLNTIRTGAGLGATAVQPGDLATVATTGDYDDLLNKPTIPAAQVQSDWTEADNTDPSYIQNKPTLATVATSGLYSDLSGTPSLATVATSGDYDDLINKPTIPAAQVQSDWTEADNTDPSYIQNKPALATVATSGLYSDLSGTPTINNVPAVTSSDDNKVLKASYTGGVGSYSWEQESGGTVTDVEVDGTSVVSGGVASITMPTELVPTVTSSDGAKVLTATYSGGTGSYSWENPAGLFEAQYGVSTYTEIAAAVQAHKNIFCRVSPNANTSRMAFLAYIGSNNFEFQYYRSNSNANQTDSVFVYTVNSSNTWSTTERTVKAGNISYPVTDVEVDGASVVSGGVASITMPTGVPAYTTTEDGKVLGVVDNQGTAELEWVAQSAGGTQADWSEADPTAPSYIENKPVPKTLVAGTGITITETANDLTVASTNQLYNAGAGLKLSSATFSLDETVLFSSANGENLKNGITLSESRLNFNRLRITYAIATNAAPAYLEIPMMGVNTGAQFIAVLTAPFDNHAYDVAGYSLVWFTYFVNCTNTYLESATSQFVGKSGFIDGTTAGSWAQGVNNNVPIIYEVVGINRIAP